MISLTAVEKRYSTEVSIGPVDLDLPAGGITALIGPNGAGKSTLLTIIGRLLDADAGTVSIAGHDVAATKSRELAKVVAVLRQENHFVTRLTVRQLVGFGRYPHSQGRLTLADEAVIDRSIDFLGLQGLEGRYLDELSGGQRQRAYVAMVLAQDTDYVLLDEPLNNLDMAHSRALMARLADLVRGSGRSVVTVVHEVNYAAAWADHVVAMKNGRVVAQGPAEAVLTEPVLSALYDTPVEVAHLTDVMDAGGWVDITRQDIPAGPLFSWWSYRNREWDLSDRGRRLDHVWATRDIAAAGHASRILRPVRGWDGPSDHVPVLAAFDLPV